MKKMLIGLLALLTIGLVASSSAVLAFGFGKGRMGDVESYDAVRDAIENNDYEAWIEAMNSQLSEEVFNSHVERHNERIAWAEENGIDLDAQRTAHDAMREAIDSNDYEAYLEAVAALEKATGKESPRSLDEEDFEKLVEMHEARESGDFQHGMMHGGQGMRGQGHGMHQGMLGQGQEGLHSRGMGNYGMMSE